MVINILGDLLGFSILSKKSSKNSLSPHPNDFNGHSCVSSTLSLTESSMSSYFQNIINISVLLIIVQIRNLNLPFLLASCILFTLDLECIWTYLFMIRPSLNSFLIFFPIKLILIDKLFKQNKTKINFIWCVYHIN